MNRDHEVYEELTLTFKQGEVESIDRIWHQDPRGGMVFKWARVPQEAMEVSS